ncbi:hypothetical protein C8J57DRAFT_1717314 [Mycena rebaudengoi]|nr:hypothetical protein C8J57DRAFT_351267 [Mycena rebaudengoi]KAJ7267726.1 hypothetical protein C8J57DRAFT_1717314 [Mycena rebaudengoi]
MEPSSTADVDPPPSAPTGAFRYIRYTTTYLSTAATWALTMGIPLSLNFGHEDIVDVGGPSSEEWRAFHRRIVKDLKDDFTFHIFPLTAVSCILTLYGIKNGVLVTSLLASFTCSSFAVSHTMLYLAYFRAMSFRDTGKVFLKHVLSTRPQDSDPYLQWDPWIIFSLPSMWSVSALGFLIISIIGAIISVLVNGGDSVPPKSPDIPPNALILPLICLALGVSSACASAYTWRVYVTGAAKDDNV